MNIHRLFYVLSCKIDSVNFNYIHKLHDEMHSAQQDMQLLLMLKMHILWYNYFNCDRGEHCWVLGEDRKILDSSFQFLWTFSKQINSTFYMSWINSFFNFIERNKSSMNFPLKWFLYSEVLWVYFLKNGYLKTTIWNIKSNILLNNFFNLFSVCAFIKTFIWICYK